MMIAIIKHRLTSRYIDFLIFLLRLHNNFSKAVFNFLTGPFDKMFYRIKDKIQTLLDADKKGLRD